MKQAQFSRDGRTYYVVSGVDFAQIGATLIADGKITLQQAGKFADAAEAGKAFHAHTNQAVKWATGRKVQAYGIVGADVRPGSDLSKRMSDRSNDAKRAARKGATGNKPADTDTAPATPTRKGKGKRKGTDTPTQAPATPSAPKPGHVSLTMSEWLTRIGKVTHDHTDGTYTTSQAAAHVKAAVNDDSYVTLTWKSSKLGRRPAGLAEAFWGDDVAATAWPSPTGAWPKSDEDTDATFAAFESQGLRYVVVTLKSGLVFHVGVAQVSGAWHTAVVEQAVE